MPEKAPQPLRCGKCRQPLPWQAFNTPAPTACPACGVDMYAAVFPAYVRGTGASGAGDPLLDDGRAGCFYHPAKQAMVACQACGRFLCALCDIELEGRHLCPGCVESGRQEGRIPSITSERTLYDQAALAMAVLPLLFWPATIVTAPLALAMVARFWNAPLSILPHTRARFVLAAFVALLEIAAWASLITMLVLR